MKKVLITLLLTLLIATAAFAGGYISANDLEAGALSSALEEDGFVIRATSEKGVTIEEIGDARIAPDGEIFNARIKLGGTGKAEYRCIAFTMDKAGKVTVYLNSSSKTDARVLIIVAADGSTVASLTADPDTAELKAGMVSAELPAGQYYMCSKSSGINIYQVVIE